MNLPDCEIDIGELAIRCPFFNDLKSNPDSIDNFLNEQISFKGTNINRPKKPQDIVLYGFGRIGRLMARMLIQTTGPGNYYRLKAIVVRKTGTNDLVKRASLLRRDSVHGRFDGTIRVDLENELLVINGNPVKFIYSSSPNEINYSEFKINSPIVIDNTGMSSSKEGLAKHLKNKEVKKVLFTAPVKKELKNIVYGVNHDDIEDEDAIIGAASCTTNAIVPVLSAVDKEFGIDNGPVSYTHLTLPTSDLV